MSASDSLGMIGQVLHGQFRVDDLVEDGKRSFLYRGAHLMLEVPIAIKCMKAPPGGSHEQFIRRFRHESRLHYKLSQASPHVVRVLASGTAVAPTGAQLTPFMVLEWLEGESLARNIAARRAKGFKGRTLNEVIRLLDPPVEALAFAHAHGIVHREVTPDNLFVASMGDGARIKVLDFGVAKILGERALDLPPPSQSMGLVPIGTPAYAAPEQYSATLGEVGPWTDVYAIALVLLEMLMDRAVMNEDDPVPMGVRVLDPSHRPTPRSLGIEVSDRVEAVLAQAVAAHPRDRQQEAGELWGMLKNALMRDQDSLQRVSKLPITEVPISPGPESLEPQTAALLLIHERDRLTVPEELRQTLDPGLTARDSVTRPRVEESAFRAALGDTLSSNISENAPDSSREPPTMVVADDELSYDDLGAKTLERPALPRAVVDAALTSGVRHAIVEPTSEAMPAPEAPSVPESMPPPSMEEHTVVMAADELRTLSLSMDTAPVSMQRAELFVADLPTLVRDPDTTAKNPDTTTVSPLKHPPKPPPALALGATWPMPPTPAPGTAPPWAAAGSPFRPVQGSAPAFQPQGQYVAGGAPMGHGHGHATAAAGAAGTTSPTQKKQSGISIALVALFLVVVLVMAVGVALWVASHFGWL